MVLLPLFNSRKGSICRSIAEVLSPMKILFRLLAACIYIGVVDSTVASLFDNRDDGMSDSNLVQGNISLHGR